MCVTGHCVCLCGVVPLESEETEPEADGLKCMDVACNPQRIADDAGRLR